MKYILGKIFLFFSGWKINKSIPVEVHGKSVMICAPHTSNWDFPLAVSVMSVLKVKIRFTIKKEWVKSPLGFLFRWFGAIGIDRSPKTKGAERPSMVQAMSELFNQNPKLCLMVPAEGSRSLQKNWKTGFYYVALTASVPILLAYLDYEKKEAGIGKVFYPSGDIEKDMLIVMEFYKDIKGKFPEKFALDERYYNPQNSEPKNGGEDIKSL
jgi:1-acyl-sn-glycerol-3-phosphate acyltransferase